MGCTKLNPAYRNHVLLCSVTRQECTKEKPDQTCDTFENVPTFTATKCAGDGEDFNAICQSEFCSSPDGITYDYPAGCKATAKDITGTGGGQLPADGVCRVDSTSRLALIGYTQTWRDCVNAPGGSSCDQLKPNSATVTQCVDVSNTPAWDQLQPPSSGRRDRSLLVNSFVPNSGSCLPVGSPPSALIYAMPIANIGTATAAGTTVTLTSVGGFAAGRQNCSEGCVSTVDRLSINLADRTVSGHQVTSVAVSNVQPITLLGVPDPDSGFVSVPTGGIRLIAKGRIDGIDSTFVMQNEKPWLASLTPALLRLQGPLDMVVTDASGHQLPITIPISLSAPAGNAQTAACAGLSPVGRLFGFEDPANWRSTNAALSFISSPITQGCGALGIAGQGYIPILGGIFSNSDLAVSSALSVDLFIPSNQPNPFYLGAVQMYLTCPSGAVFNQYIGQVELTGKPTNRFSTLRFPLPAATLSTLGQPLKDCHFDFALNVNQTGQNWILDNLRFTQ
jgi:hypothetical protein